MSRTPKRYYDSVPAYVVVGRTETLNACGDAVRPQQSGQESVKREDSTEQLILVSLS
ncbi:hypothetical protein J4G02_16875 [Candidatus Poribacteria bacterium]|nr:hypothetical protein [Candidatus Poribacteria bacterium]